MLRIKASTMPMVAQQGRDGIYLYQQNVFRSYPSLIYKISSYPTPSKCNGTTVSMFHFVGP